MKGQWLLYIGSSMEVGKCFFEHFWEKFDREKLDVFMDDNIKLYFIDDNNVEVNGKKEVMDYLGALHKASLPKLKVVKHFTNPRFLSIIYQYISDDKPEMIMHEFDIADDKIRRLVMIIDSISETQSDESD